MDKHNRTFVTASHSFPFPGLHSSQAQPVAASFGSQLDPNLQDLDSGDAFAQHFNAQLGVTSHGQHLHVDDSYHGDASARFQEISSQTTPARRRQLRVSQNVGQFGILTPPQHNALERLQQEHETLQASKSAGRLGKGDGHFANMKMIPNPPDLRVWRERLFHVNEIITLSENDFLTYFPHVDNIYSHRSTQRYKRKPFVSHYWDCRLKGRPPGTPKSDDPNKRKRKRQARERDLCDVKIKITEYFPGARALLGPELAGSADDTADVLFPQGEQFESAGQNLQQAQTFGATTSINGNPAYPGSNGERFFTIQRVNGNGGNGKGDGVAGPHKHDLEESDRVKKNSILRQQLKGQKEMKKVQWMDPFKQREQHRAYRLGARHFRDCITFNLEHYQFTVFTSDVEIMFLRRYLPYFGNAVRSEVTNTDVKSSGQKTYHKKATGTALVTVKRHSKEHELKLFGSCFCPFVQRVWIALETKNMDYQYIEVDPYKKPESLLEVNPQGLVPALRHGDWACYESTVLIEYLEDLNMGDPLLPQGDPQQRAHSRLWADHVNRKIIPAFYHYIQAQEPIKQVENAEELKNAITKLVDAAHPTGPFFLGSNISFVDVQLAPWLLRMRRVLKPYRGWPDPEEGSRWANWVDAVENNRCVKATTSTDELYLDSYERYAENRPNTSQVANAINSGRGLP